MQASATSQKTMPERRPRNASVLPVTNQREGNQPRALPNTYHFGFLTAHHSPGSPSVAACSRQIVPRARTGIGDTWRKEAQVSTANPCDRMTATAIAVCGQCMMPRFRFVARRERLRCVQQVRSDCAGRNQVQGPVSNLPVAVDDFEIVKVSNFKEFQPK